MSGLRNGAARRDAPVRIGILDDEPLICEMLTETLELAGFEVWRFATPAEALASLAWRSCDVILCDLHMPAMNGMDFCAQVVARYPDQAARILLCSGDGLAPDTQQFLTRTGSLYLQKPFTQAALLACIHAVLRRSARAAQSSLRSGNSLSAQAKAA